MVNKCQSVDQSVDAQQVVIPCSNKWWNGTKGRAPLLYTSWETSPPHGSSQSSQKFERPYWSMYPLCTLSHAYLVQVPDTARSAATKHKTTHFEYSGCYARAGFWLEQIIDIRIAVTHIHRHTAGIHGQEILCQRLWKGRRLVLQRVEVRAHLITHDRSTCRCIPSMEWCT